MQLIVYDARTVCPGMSGVGRYTLNLLRALATLPNRPSMRAYFMPEELAAARNDGALRGLELLAAPHSHHSHPRGDLWLERTLARSIPPHAVYHGPAFLVPGGHRDFAQVTTIHDLFVFTYPEFFNWKFRTWLRRAIRRAGRASDMIIAPTQTVADEIVAAGLASRSKIRTVYEAPDDTPEAWEGKGQTAEQWLADHPRPTRYFLTVATRDRRKDPVTAQQAFVMLKERTNQAADVEWWWIGGPGTTPDPTSPNLARAAQAAGFRTLGAVPGRAVQHLLTHAAAYVTSSRAEGFGLPLVEALTRDCPVLATDLPVHREVLGDAAAYFPVADAASLADKLERFLQAPQRSPDLACRGRQRAACFSWHEAARQTLQVYGEAFASRAQARKAI